MTEQEKNLNGLMRRTKSLMEWVSTSKKGFEVEKLSLRQLMKIL
nr:MAG TPA: hypothetical protein [Caudoviricetes sp.]